jgi:hypothetical protein
MQHKSNKGYSEVSQLGILLMFFGLGIVLVTIFQYLYGLKFISHTESYPNIAEKMAEAFKDPKNLTAIRWMQFLSTLAMFFIPAFLYSRICNGKNIFWLGFNNKINQYQILIGFMIIFFSNLISAPLQELTEKLLMHFPSIQARATMLEKLYNDEVVLMAHFSGFADLLLSVIILALMPAIFEELFFRGALQSILEIWWNKPIWAIIVSSLIFSLIHFSINLFLSRAFLGFALGLMFYKTRNIWINIIAHFLNNAIAIFQLYVLSKSKKPIDASKLDVKLEWWYILIGIGVLYGLFIFLQKYSETNVKKINTQAYHLSNSDEQHHKLN